MDLGKLPLFTMMSQRVAWLGKRQQVLAQNIANGDTPNYRAQELKEPTFKDLLAPGGGRNRGMVVTQVNHILPTRGADQAGRFKAVEDKAAETDLNGNSVDVESQVMQVAQTAMDHQVTVNLYRKHIAMLKAALGRPGG